MHGFFEALLVNYNMMNETTIESTTIYEGRVVTLRVDTVNGPSGITTREIIDHVPAVTILPFNGPDDIWLIHQFRKAVDEVLIEAPAGCMEPHETPLMAAHRELKEETGGVASTMIPVGEMYMAPGFCNEFMTIFLATDLTMGKPSFDHDETMLLHHYSLTQIDDMMRRGAIKDAKTILAIHYLKQHLSHGV